MNDFMRKLESINLDQRIKRMQALDLIRIVLKEMASFDEKLEHKISSLEEKTDLMCLEIAKVINKVNVLSKATAKMAESHNLREAYKLANEDIENQNGQCKECSCSEEYINLCILDDKLKEVLHQLAMIRSELK